MNISVLFVCSGNSGIISPFIMDQSNSLQREGLEIDFFLINGKGAFGYLKNLKVLRNKIDTGKYDIIHAHYGLSGLLANLQRKIPVITTFHGSDVNVKKNRLFSRVAAYLSAHSIFVSKELREILRQSRKFTVIPCGVDINIFKPINNKDQYKDTSLIKILFSSSFDRSVKNPELAKKAVDIINTKIGIKSKLIELKGYNRQEVAKLMNEIEVCLLTSYTEGSPQFIKEAMACNCPVVSTDVGDVSWLFGKEKGHYITTYEPADVVGKLKQAIEYSMTQGRTNGRNRIISLELDSNTITKNIKEVYKKVLNR